MTRNDTQTPPPEALESPPVVRYLPVVIAAIIGIVISAAAFLGIRQREADVIRQEFAETSDVVLLDVEKSLDRSLLLTDALHSFFTNSKNVTRHEFHEFVRGTEKYLQGIQALQWVPRVPADQRIAYEARAWATGYPNFKIKDLDAQGRVVPAGPKGEYYPIYYLAPLAGNERVLGFDVMSKPFSGTPRLKARDSGEMRVSGRITLIQETGQQFGFIFFKPVYNGSPETVQERRKALRGYIQLVLRGGDFIEYAMGNTEHRGLAVYLHDMSAPADEQFLHAFKANGMPYDEALSKPHKSQDISIGGRTWRLTCVAKDEFITRFKTNYAYVTGASGLALTALLCAYLLTLTGQARKTQQLVEVRTRELKDSRERFNLALQGGDLGLWDWNISTGEVVFDQRWADMLEYQLEEIAPHVDSWSKLVHPEDMKSVVEPALKAHFEGFAPLYSAEHRMRSKSGQWKWILDRGRVVERAEDGTPLRAVGTHMDITEAKNTQLELSNLKERLEMALVASEAGLWDWDIATDEVFYDAQWARILGYSRSELPSTLETWQKTVHPDDVPHVENELKKALEPDFKGLYQVEYRAPRKSGEWIWIVARGNVMKRDEFGAPLRMIGTIQDITQSKLLEDELRQAKEDADKANQAKSDFLANMSHEIRTPMNAVIGLTDLALTTVLTPKQRDYLKKIRHSSKTLLGVINDILDFSKIEAGKLHLEQTEFRIGDIFSRVSDMFTDRMQEKGLEFHVKHAPGLPATLIGDPLRLEQVLVNLTGNALKFTEKGSVTVEAALADDNAVCDENASVVFTISDTGIGIPKDKQGNLFRSFTQADSTTTRKYGGSGLGLSICKRLVDLMGGKIWLESEEAQGSTFGFTLTFPCGLDDRVSGAPAKGFAGMRALVVDDHETTRQILNDMLTAFGFEVVEEHSAESALTRVEGGDRQYDLILADLRLPNMDGLDMSARIRQIDMPLSPKIVLITAYGLDEALHGSQVDQVDTVLLKPIQQSTLLNAINEVLALKRPGASDTSNALVSFKGGRVLLVEDNDINQQVASEILVGLGLTVDIAVNGKNALEMLEVDHKYDVVLMDVQMPVMDGYQATRAIRQSESFSHLPIVAMTAHAMSGDKEKCLAAGMDDYISKPVDQKLLRDTLAKWLTPDENAPVLEGLSPAGEAPPPPPAAAVQIPPIEGMDITAGLSRLGGNVDLLRKLYADFHKTYADCPQQIRDAMAKGETEDARRIAHTIKGVAGNIGAMDVHREASALESALRHGQPFEEHYEAFSKVLGTVIDALSKQDFIAPANQPPQDAEEDAPSPQDAAAQSDRKIVHASREDALEVLEDLTRLVDSNSFDAGRKAAQAQKSLAGLALDKHFTALIDALTIFNYTTAKKVLTEMITTLQTQDKE